MERIRCSAVLFDLDGVLIDSTPAVARVWSGWARDHGLDPEQTVQNAHGRPSIDSIREILPDADHEKENDEVERREIADLGGGVPPHCPGWGYVLPDCPLREILYPPPTSQKGTRPRSPT